MSITQLTKACVIETSVSSNWLVNLTLVRWDDVCSVLDEANFCFLYVLFFFSDVLASLVGVVVFECVLGRGDVNVDDFVDCWLMSGCGWVFIGALAEDSINFGISNRLHTSNSFWD